MSELRRTNVKYPELITIQRDRIERTAKLASDYFSQNHLKLDHPDGFSGISIPELTRLGYKILDCDNIWQVYDLLALPSSRGTCYYDVVIRPQHIRGYEEMQSALYRLEQTRAKTGLDLGTGSGEMALVLGSVCDHVTAIDVVPSLLKVAQGKLRKAVKSKQITAFDIQEMDMLEINLPAESVDIITDNGTQVYLTNEERTVLLKQMYRILKPGGRYYEYQANNPEPSEYSTSPRALLAGEVSATMIGFTFNKRNKGEKPTINGADYGFTAELYPIEDIFKPREYKEFIMRLVKN